MHGTFTQSQRLRSEQGFTLMELLVVILIIGVLAAIAIPLFLSQRAKGQDAQAKSGAALAANAMEACANDNKGDFTGCDDLTTLKDIEPALNDYTVTFPVAASDNAYSVRAVSDSSSDGGGSFTVTKTDGVTVRTCANPGKGGCKTAGGDGNMW